MRGALRDFHRLPMTSTVFLRIASIVSGLFAVGHTVGGTQSWSPSGETEVLRAMKSFRFDAEGVSRSYYDFYLGFGFTISVYLLLQAVLLWQLAAIAKTEPLRARPLIGSFFLASVACAFVSWRFIFAVPVVFAALVAVSLGAALLASRRSAAS
jgi:hypothetical protein